MTEADTLELLNSRVPPFFKVLGGKIVEIDEKSQSATLHFDISTDLCHSVDVVQGGFITAMLDAAMSHAVFAADREIRTLSSLEISTRYLDVARAGFLVAVGRITRASYKTAFLEGELRDGEGKLLATTQSVAKLGRKS